MSRMKRHDAGQPVIITILFVTLVAMALATGGCGKQMARMEDNQVKLQAMVMANARQLATVSSQVHVGQSELNRTLAKIDQKADGINSEVLTVQNTQTQLRETMVSGNRQINRKIAQLETNQAFLKDGVAQVANIAQNTNVAVGAVAKDQATLHRIVQSNKLELDDRLAAVAQNQQRTHTGLDQLGEADRSLAGQISGVATQQDVLQRLAQDNTQQLVGHLTTLGTEQTALHNSLKTGTQTLADKLAILEQHQLDVQSVIDRVANTTSTTADDVTTLAATQSQMQQTQSVRYENLTGQLATAAQNQRTLQTGIGTLDAKADRTTSQLTTLAAGQSTIQETMQANNTSVAAGLTHLADNQGTLRDNIQRLDDHSQSLAADLGKAITNQATTQDTLVKSSEAFAAFAENQTELQRHVSDLNGKADAMASHISSVATELGTVHETVKTGNNAVAAQVTTLAEGQQNLTTDIGHLSEQTNQLAAGQTTLSQTMQSHADAAHGQMTDMANDQRTVRDHVDAVMTTASQLALNIVTMSNRQAQFEQEVQTGLADLDQGTDQLAAGQNSLNLALQEDRESLAGQLGDVATNQQTLQGSVEALTTTTNQIELNLASVGDGQNALNKSLQAHDESVAGGMANLANTQGRIQGELDTVAATTTQVALDIITLDDNQGKLGLAAQTDREMLNARLTDVAQNQQQVQSGLDTLTATTTQVALDVITLDGNQAQQGQNLQANHQELVSTLTAAAQSQQQMQGSLDVITATTSQVGLDVMALDDKQGKIGQTLQAGQQQFGPRLTQLAENQQQIQTGLDTLTSTTTQVALDVITLDDQQAKQGQALLATQQAFTTQIENVTQGQQQMQSNLDTVTATTSQVALDVITLDDNQARIEQAVQANRQELATRLTEIAQGQQQWLARFDAAEAKVETMTAGITALEQRITKLQGTLQTSLQDLSTLLDTESQQRVQFQNTVRQDVQSVTDSIAQLREIQAGLAEHIQRVQDSTQNQNSDILSALEQLQKKTDANVANVDTELKSSKATPQEIMLP